MAKVIIMTSVPAGSDQHLAQYDRRGFTSVDCYGRHMAIEEFEIGCIMKTTRHTESRIDRASGLWEQTNMRVVERIFAIPDEHKSAT